MAENSNFAKAQILEHRTIRKGSQCINVQLDFTQSLKVLKPVNILEKSYLKSLT